MQLSPPLTGHRQARDDEHAHDDDDAHDAHNDDDAHDDDDDDHDPHGAPQAGEERRSAD